MLISRETNFNRDYMHKTLRRFLRAMLTGKNARWCARAAVCPIAAALMSARVDAQQPSPPPPPKTDTVAPATPRVPPVEVSGIIFANFQYRSDRGLARAANRFDVERVYLTFRAQAGERASIRVTTDLFQQQATGNDSFYRGWVLRAKYAYFQYDYLKRQGLTGVARLGLVHNVFIDHDESFWPRWIGTTPTDRHGFFSSADAGLVTLLTLPRNWGEAYITVVNGPGFTSRELDRFKDYAARLTVTPFASERTSPLRTLALTAWAYNGAVGSKFAAGGTGQIGPIGSSLNRDRWGMFAGLRDPRLTGALQYARRSDEGETGANTAASPRAMVDSSGSVAAVFAMVRPLRGSDGRSPHPLALLARLDRVSPHRDRGDKYHLVVAGFIWDITRAASVSLDYQEQLPQEGTTISPNKTYFLHLVARF